MPATLELAFLAMLVALLIGIPLGLAASLRPPSSLFSRLVIGGSILGFSVPAFWVGILLIMFFAVYLGILPPTGRGTTRALLGVEVSFLTWDGLRHLVLPVLNLAFFQLSLIIRLTEASAREALQTDYVRFAEAKGLHPLRITFVHVLKNVLIPIVTVTGLELGSLIAYAVVTESIFAWPGMGKLIVDSINSLDRPVIVAYLIIIVLMFVFINLVVDVVYSLIDPRIRLSEAEA
jgi:peptide/nickel transport system permease protein